MFKPDNWLERVFKRGIVGKGLNGAAELIGGTLVLFFTPARIHQVVAALTQGELSEDPHDFLATHFLRTGNGLSGHALMFGAIYLLAHGLIKVVLVVALLLNEIWAYPCMITVFDLLIVVLTWREYKQQRRRRRNQPPMVAAKHSPIATSGRGAQ